MPLLPRFTVFFCTTTSWGRSTVNASIGPPFSFLPTGCTMMRSQPFSSSDRDADDAGHRVLHLVSEEDVAHRLFSELLVCFHIRTAHRSSPQPFHPHSSA